MKLLFVFSLRAINFLGSKLQNNVIDPKSDEE